jgi:hypothetical protein
VSLQAAFGRLVFWAAGICAGDRIRDGGKAKRVAVIPVPDDDELGRDARIPFEGDGKPEQDARIRISDGDKPKQDDGKPKGDVVIPFRGDGKPKRGDRNRFRSGGKPKRDDRNRSRGDRRRVAAFASPAHRPACATRSARTPPKARFRDEFLSTCGPQPR